jgi:integrase
MPRQAREASAIALSKLTTPGLHFAGGTPGLALQVSPSGARSWILRAMVAGKRREMGLGRYPDVTLAQARERARQARDIIRSGKDPIDEQRVARSALQASRATAVTFEQASRSYIDAHEAGWRNSKHAQQWRNTLATYAHPRIGSMLVRDISVPQVLSILEPIWHDKTETASRVRNRIELVLSWAAARGLRDGPNPARWRGHLDAILPKRARIAPVKHHRAVPVAEVGAFVRQLRTMESIAARALDFLILTNVRSRNVRSVTWDEIDLRARVWTIPGDSDPKGSSHRQRMKAGREHRVPLSEQAIKLLKSLPRVEGTTLVFPSPTGRVMSDMALSAVMRRMAAKGVPHGFRSAFRDWAGELTSHPREVIESAMAHQIGDAAERAYARGDLFEKRRLLMSDWAAFLARDKRQSNVVPMARRRA